MMTGETREVGLAMISLGARGLASLAGRLLSKRGQLFFVESHGKLDQV